ncbi:MAG: hypothetical protein SFV54_27865 [Bryobacteraceae bacterium]|nr:hypothetical protein [Bryobacteraceae bacterium]
MLARALALCFLLLVEALPQTYSGRIGIEIEGPKEGSRSRAFVDLGRGFRPVTTPVDDRGWPTTDATVLLFDIRPVAAWENNIDDPDRFSPDWSGRYTVSFEGRADLAVSTPNNRAAISNVQYDAATNITSADLVVQTGAELLQLVFTNTRRTPGGATNTGLRNLRVLRPGYAGSKQPYSNEFLDAIPPFQILRFMGFTETNSDFAPRWPETLEWSDRHTPADATQQRLGKRIGVAWEYVIHLANITGKDIWINVPAPASDNYVRQLARLLQTTLRPGANIYLEHSNEVWNPGFPQQRWNTAAAGAEATTPIRRHARRLYEISRIFGEVFGQAEINRRIRPVYAWWPGRTQEYREALNYIRATFGPPSQFFYGMATTHYIGARVTETAAVGDILAAMRQAAETLRLGDQQHKAVADDFGLKFLVYEGGPDNGQNYATVTTPNGVRPVANVGNHILANRSREMREIIVGDIRDGFFANGGDLYMYFTLSSAYSRWGCWGLTEDIVNRNTEKFLGLYELVGRGSAPRIDRYSSSATGTLAIAPGSLLSVYGEHFSPKELDWTYAIWEGRVLPANLGAVRVRLNGKECHLHYAGPFQLNVLLPPDATSGPLEVTTPYGTARVDIEVTPFAPGLFSYGLGNVRYASALHAGTRTYVAPAGALPGYDSRPARPGDVIELYASGLGPVAGTPPTGEVLSQAYPTAGAVRVTVGGVPARVLYSGLVNAGLYQINVEIPTGVSAGDQFFVVEAGNRTSPSGIALRIGQ